MSLIGDELKFYQSFIDTINERPEELASDIEENIKDSGFRRHLQSKSVNADLIKELAPYMRHMISKPQELIYDNDEHYIALDQFTNTYYVCYKHLLMIDFDNYKETPCQIEDILPHCGCQITQVIEHKDEIIGQRKATWMNYQCKTPGRCPNRYRYRIYKSNNGYHAFIISHKMNYRNEFAIQLMCEAMTDYFYMIYAYLRGWCVRINRKKHEEAIEYPYYGDVVDGKIVDLEDPTLPAVNEDLAKEVKLHLNLLDVFRDSGCVM